ALFRDVFRGRTDVHAQHWSSQTGTASLVCGYKPVYVPLAEDLIRDHLLGRRILGIYPLLLDDRTWFLAADCDGPSSSDDARTIAQALGRCGLSSYLERSRSGEGMHVWVFFSEPVEAYKIRTLAKMRLKRVGLPSFDRFFPSQDRHSGKKL